MSMITLLIFLDTKTLPWHPERTEKSSYFPDGGFSDNLPILDCETVTVSPFSGCADICPLDSTLSDILTVFL